ncbi:MAG: hypothetical protein J6U86_04275, partial [Clostridia bacterium]|nr:hypothetical protein [Clostridia bacterium]
KAAEEYALRAENAQNTAVTASEEALSSSRSCASNAFICIDAEQTASYAKDKVVALVGENGEKLAFVNELAERIAPDIQSRLTEAEEALGAIEDADGGKEYPELQTDNTAVIPALNELLARLGVIAGAVEKKAESHDTSTSGGFSHRGSLSVSEGISARNVSASTLEADALNGNALTLTDRASIPTLSSDTISVQQLNVTGKAVIKEQEQVLIRDSVMVLNSDGESIDGAYSGIVMRSGEDTAYAILLNMGTQSVRLGYGQYDADENSFAFSEGETGVIMTREESDLLSDGGVLYWDAESHRAKTAGLDATLAEELFEALADRRLPEYEGNYLCVSGGSIRLTPPDRLVSVSEVEQTTTSSADGGINVVTVRLSDGSTSSFEVRNGNRGSKGDKGEKGDAGDVSLSYANKSFANALKGEATGEVVILNDVSPISHELELSVTTADNPESVSVTCHGRNIFDPQAYSATPMTNTTLVGDVFTTEFISNGSYVNAPWHKGVVLPKGKYTISVFSAEGDMSIGIGLYPANTYDRDLGYISCREASKAQKT